ncbi:MAG: hypothetical protein R3Y56_07620 [Akkermansia sp.]
MQHSNIPQIKLPTTDYSKMRHMNHMRLVGVFRSAVLAPERWGHFSSRPAAEHDSYRVRHEADCISITLLHTGEAVFRCVFLPAQDEY